MFFPVPDLDPIISVVEMLFYGGIFALAFATGWIAGGRR